MWIRYHVSLWPHLVPPGWAQRREEVTQTCLFCGSWIPATSESGVSLLAGPASMSKAGCYFVKMISDCRLSRDLVLSWICRCLKSMSGILARLRRTTIFGPAYSLSWSTALLRTLCKTDTKEKQRVGGRKERKYLAEGRHKLPEPAWMSCHRQCIPAWT